MSVGTGMGHAGESGDTAVFTGKRVHGMFCDRPFLTSLVVARLRLHRHLSMPVSSSEQFLVTSAALVTSEVSQSAHTWGWMGGGQPAMGAALTGGKVAG